MTRTHANQIAASFSFPFLFASAFPSVQDSISGGGLTQALPGDVEKKTKPSLS